MNYLMIWQRLSEVLPLIGNGYISEADYAKAVISGRKLRRRYGAVGDGTPERMSKKRDFNSHSAKDGQ